MCAWTLRCLSTYVALLTQRIPMPRGAQEILSHVQGACRDRGPAYLLTSSAPGAAKRCMVSACGWLLGYPVIYALREEHAAIASCPLPDSFAADNDWEELATSLTDVSLYRVEAQVLSPLTTHTLLAFSVPHSLPDADTLVQQAARTLQHRTQQALDQHPWQASIAVRTTQVHMDRVAL